MQPGREFAADSYVFAPLADNAELDPMSDAYVANVNRQIATYYGHVDFGESSPIYVVDENQPTIQVQSFSSFQPLQNLFQNVPVPASNFVVDPGTDHEVTIYQPSTGKMWEFWIMQPNGQNTTDSAGNVVIQWGAQWGGRMDNVSTNPGYWVPTPEGYKFGATASGIPLLAGMLTIDELETGVIDHVVGISLVELAALKYSFPAQRTDGGSYAADAVPEGTIFRFPANLNLDAMITDRLALMIAKAIQKHGMIVWDGAGAVAIRVENNKPGTNPYYSDNGILGCSGLDPVNPYASGNVWWCWPPAHLMAIPWTQLQALKPKG